MKDKQIVRFSVSLPLELLKKLDEKTLQKGYSSRSEVVRDMIRELIVEEKWEKKEEVIGVLVIMYDHHKHGLTEKMLEVEHANPSQILCTTHVHLDHETCLETIIIKGKPEEIEATSVKIGGLNGVKFAKLVKTAPI